MEKSRLNMLNFVREKVQIGFKAIDENIYSQQQSRNSQLAGLGENIFPNDFLINGLNKRAISAQSGTGTNLVPEDNRGDLTYIMLDSAINELGVNFFNAGFNDIKIPQFTSYADASFVDEGSAASDGDPSNSSITLKPRALQIIFPITRVLNLTMPDSVKAMFERDVIASFYRKMINAAIATGITTVNTNHMLNNSDVNSVDGTSFDYAAAVEMVKTSQNAISSSNKKWLMNGNTFETLALRLKEAGQDDYLIPTNNSGGLSLVNYPIVVSNTITDNNLVFGDFSNISIPIFFDNVFLMVNPYNRDGSVEMVFTIYTDFGIQNPNQFVKSTIS